MIDRIRLTAAAKIQLATLKRKTGIEHHNSLCRHALCISLANATLPPKEDFNFNGGLEIDWKVFTGGNETLYLNLLLARYGELSVEGMRDVLCAHLHRGLSYMLVKANFCDDFSLPH